MNNSVVSLINTHTHKSDLDFKNKLLKKKMKRKTLLNKTNCFNSVSSFFLSGKSRATSIERNTTPSVDSPLHGSEGSKGRSRSVALSRENRQGHQAASFVVLQTG